MKQIEYDIRFDTKNPNSNKLKSAFGQVSDIRKFEIELYWKRAGYFWALIAVAFAGYFAILSSQHIQNKFFLSFTVSSIGFVFTFAWYLVNRGSKYWQENWENHLDLLEDEITGPLYKTILERPKLSSLTEKLVTGPLSVSVSKINQWVSVFVLTVWIILAAYSSRHLFTQFNILNQNRLMFFAYAFVAIIALICCFLMFKRGKTDKEDYAPKTRVRKTKIEDPS